MSRSVWGLAQPPTRSARELPTTWLCPHAAGLAARCEMDAAPNWRPARRSAPGERGGAHATPAATVSRRSTRLPPPGLVCPQVQHPRRRKLHTTTRLRGKRVRTSTEMRRPTWCKKRRGASRARSHVEHSHHACEGQESLCPSCCSLPSAGQNRTPKKHSAGQHNQQSTRRP